MSTHRLMTVSTLISTARALKDDGMSEEDIVLVVKSALDREAEEEVKEVRLQLGDKMRRLELDEDQRRAFEEVKANEPATHEEFRRCASEGLDPVVVGKDANGKIAFVSGFLRLRTALRLDVDPRAIRILDPEGEEVSELVRQQALSYAKRPRRL